MYTRICIYCIHTYVCICMHVCVFVCEAVCIYIYIYIYILKFCMIFQKKKMNVDGDDEDLFGFLSSTYIIQRIH